MSWLAKGVSNLRLDDDTLTCDCHIPSEQFDQHVFQNPAPPPQRIPTLFCPFLAHRALHPLSLFPHLPAFRSYRRIALHQAVGFELSLQKCKTRRRLHPFKQSCRAQNCSQIHRRYCSNTIPSCLRLRLATLLLQTPSFPLQTHHFGRTRKQAFELSVCKNEVTQTRFYTHFRLRLMAMCASLGRHTSRIQPYFYVHVTPGLRFFLDNNCLRTLTEKRSSSFMMSVAPSTMSLLVSTPFPSPSQSSHYSRPG